jgi:hypothetical protein
MAMIFILGIAACDTGSSSDSDDDTEGTPTTPGDSAIPTIDQLVGIWVNRRVETGNYSINTENQTLTITKTGTNTATYISSELYRRDFTDGNEEPFTYYLSGNWLVLSDRNTTSTTSFGWEKQ